MMFINSAILKLEKCLGYLKARKTAVISKEIQN